MGKSVTARPAARASRMAATIVDGGGVKRGWSTMSVEAASAWYQGTTSSTWSAPAAAISSRSGR